MGLLNFLLVGLIAGALASYILGRQQDLLINLLIGIIGAVVGGLLAGLLGLGAYRSARSSSPPSARSSAFGVAAHSLNEWIGEQACGVKPSG
jgi:uncharacterized membrane protein YeaQ/YmgE (transglycosylase-associated protein family)